MLLGPVFLKRHHLADCLSTNLKLWELLDSAKDEDDAVGLYVTADYQLKGRGQGTNNWYSSHKTNLLFSYTISPEGIPPVFQFDISRIASLMLSDFLRNTLPTSCTVKIKWPNDIYVNQMKIAGMLIENRILGTQISSSIIGIGININEQTFPEEINCPTSFRLLTGSEFDLDDILERITRSFRQKNRAIKTYEPETLHKEYDKHLYGLGRKMEFSVKNRRFEGTILGTDRAGLLRVETEGKVNYYGIKEIQFNPRG
jgi:BirA family transcriptional regulator, biotin operon repressor / biotin---[acetyl-CoA-carboxylase] ligase